jgi:hypothetical protein
MRYASASIGRGERRLGLRSRAVLTPSSGQQTVLARPPRARPVTLRRPRALRRDAVGLVGRSHLPMQWTGTLASRAERRTGAAAAPWHG